MIVVLIPVKIISEANSRDHWRVKAKRVAAHREAARWSLGVHLMGEPIPRPPLLITLTRIAPRTLDDDNLASGFKAVRDGVADALCINDADPGVTWRYAQRKGKDSVAEVRIVDEWREKLGLEY